MCPVLLQCNWTRKLGPRVWSQVCSYVSTEEEAQCRLMLYQVCQNIGPAVAGSAGPVPPPLNAGTDSGQSCGPGRQCIYCDNIYTTVTQTLTTDVPAAAVLYFQGDMEQSLLIGEEFDTEHSSEA